MTPKLPDRPDDSHKGTFGTVIVIGGTPTMIGAPALAATAALRTGCGLVKIATFEELVPHCLTIQPSATGIVLPMSEEIDLFLEGLDTKNILAVGPGMGQGLYQQTFVCDLMRWTGQVVLDADGLNMLASLPRKLMSPDCESLIVTPHPGEYRRLAEQLGITQSPTDPSTRPAAARELANALNAIVVLKGRETVISDGTDEVVNSTGNAVLATAGSGDVLTGAIASLLAQGMSPFDAAVAGVYLHGEAADRWAIVNGKSGLVAMDLADEIPSTMNVMRISYGGF